MRSLVNVFESLAALLVLPCLMGLVTSDVILSYGFGQPIFWADDVKKLLLLLTLTLGMASTSYFQEHIRVSLLVDILPKGLRRFLTRLTSLFNVMVLSIIAYSCYLLTLDMFEYQDRAEKVAIYFWPIAAIITLTIILAMVVEAYKFVVTNKE